ncbi:leucine-rich repeat domain-containing protein [Ekhidna sp.]|uniref:leucine-rich repeat domain-containing protein n=1 Tax=Ekhidna sp. TaxID=2608089 RepID=UPI003B50B88A
MIKQFTYILTFLVGLTTLAQSSSDSTNFEEVRSLVNFYEYMLNSVGSQKTSTRDKEVIITQSYKKIFEDDRVQIEDDLLDDRKVITNKDVTAYLRDVNFFFNDIQFDFEENEIQKLERPNGLAFYLVSLECSIEGVTIEGNPYKKNQKRFLEINVDEAEADLKIASVYSTKVSREEELRNWWFNLSFGWKNLLESYVPFDSISFPILEKIAAIDSLNLSGDPYIQDIEALVALRELRFLDISNTKIDNLEPLRYSMGLKTLIARNSSVENIEALRYFDKLKFLDISQTRVDDLTAIGKLSELTHLNVSATYAFSFEALSNLKNLEYINLTDTEFSDLKLLSQNKNLTSVFVAQSQVGSLLPIQDLSKIQELDASESKITNLNGLESHPTLKKVSLNLTEVSTLNPLVELPALRKVYADYTNVSEDAAASFMSERPNVLVVTNSEKVLEWWAGLSANWKHVLGQIGGINALTPDKDDLVKLINSDSLNLSNKKLYEPTPLRKFKRVRYLNVSQNLFTTFGFTDEMPELKVLNGADLPVESCAGLDKNPNLRRLILKGSLVKDLSDLHTLKDLQYLDVDDTPIGEKEVASLINANKNVTVLFKSNELKTWWLQLPAPWKQTFGLKDPDSESLHRLIESSKISIKNQPITSLEPLDVFINLKEVILENVRMNSLAELFKHTSIESITCTNGPLQSLEGITKLTSLNYLNFQNTAIDDLKDLEGMKSLKHLNCAGTSIKNLKGIEGIYNLVSLDVSNTRVWKLSRLAEMKSLKRLVCFNTRLRQHVIDDFQKMNPDCEINYY